MWRANKILLVLCIAWALISGWLLYEYLHVGSTPTKPEAPELATYMVSLQRYTHKLALSVEARNKPAARFYLHGLEEGTETIVDDVPSYGGHAIGGLTNTMLVPQIEAVEAALDAADWAQTDTRLGQMVQSCNQCHQSTEHGFIRIEGHTDVNPFAQSFAPSDTSGAQGP